MAASSDEGDLPGLGWFNATVKKFDEARLHHKPKIPHMGWNTIAPVADHSLFKEVDFDKGFYFLHSYYFECEDRADVLAKTTYGDEFACAVKKGNIYGLQFHPEKGHNGPGCLTIIICQ